MNQVDVEGIAGLVWYAECMDRAWKEVASFTPPARDMRFHHSLFVVNLMSLLEHSVELFGEIVFAEWTLKLDGVGGQNGENNAQYVRELRNSVIHRGTDIASAGLVKCNHVRVIAPSQISDRFAKRGPFKAFAHTLFEIFDISRQAACSVVLQHAAPILSALEAQPLAEIRHNYLREVAATPHMPEWAKKMAIESIDEVPFAELRTLNAKRLRTLLS